MKVLVFGVSGQVATHLNQHDWVTGLGREQADLSDSETCAAIIRDSDADAIINAAAYTAVDRAESEPDLARRVNATTPGAMAQAAADRDIPFLHISTDYVFDGQGEDPFRPDASPGPLNVYGRTKLAGEEAVRGAGGRHAILRTSWVFSAHGMNFAKSMLRLPETRDALTIVEDQIGGPTPAGAIADALMIMARAIADGQGGGTYHFAGAPDTSWKCFARETFVAAGRDVKIIGIPTADYPTPARRPLNSRLDCSDLASDFGVTRPDWKAALRDIVKELT